MPNFEVTERKENSIITLDLSGRIIFGEGSKHLHRIFRQLVERGESKILLNFSEVSCIDSSGLGELVGGYVALKRIDGEIKIFNLSENVRDLFELTKLNAVFDIFENEKEAAESFEAPANHSSSVSSVT